MLSKFEHILESNLSNIFMENHYNFFNNWYKKLMFLTLVKHLDGFQCNVYFLPYKYLSMGIEIFWRYSNPILDTIKGTTNAVHSHRFAVYISTRQLCLYLCYIHRPDTLYNVCLTNYWNVRPCLACLSYLLITSSLWRSIAVKIEDLDKNCDWSEVRYVGIQAFEFQY